MIIIVALAVTWFIFWVAFKLLKAVYEIIPVQPLGDSDYWNDAGDGSGVNYVQMPDGSVRID